MYVVVKPTCFVMHLLTEATGKRERETEFEEEEIIALYKTGLFSVHTNIEYEQKRGLFLESKCILLRLSIAYAYEFAMVIGIM